MTQDERLVGTPETPGEQRDDRRAFFAAAIGAAAIGAGAFLFSDPLSAQTITDTDVLNFALNLEYLQANYYGYAFAGAGLGTADTQSGAATPTPGGQIIGGQQVTFADPIVAAYAKELANVQLNQVRFLRTALGTSAVAQPQLDLGFTATNAFSLMAQNAGLVGPGAVFNPYSSDANFLLGAFFLQDLAVSAYQGMIQLTASKTYQEAVGGLMATEAYQAA